MGFKDGFCALDAQGEARALLKILHAGSMSREEILDLIAISEEQKQAREELNADTPQYSSNLTACLEYRRKVAEHFERLAAKRLLPPVNRE